VPNVSRETTRVQASLRRKRDRIRALLAEPISARARYAVGKTIADIKGRPEKYGEGAVARLAASLEEDLPSLYRYATVAECWSPAQFEALLLRAGADGHHLSWSHLVLIAGVASPASRAHWTDRVLKDRLSVRELGALLSASMPAGDGQGRSAVASLGRIARISERWIGTLDSRVGAALATLASASRPSPGLRAALERLVTAQERLRNATDHHIERLRAELGVGRA
jgi:hypothetical protein